MTGTDAQSSGSTASGSEQALNTATAGDWYATSSMPGGNEATSMDGIDNTPALDEPTSGRYDRCAKPSKVDIDTERLSSNLLHIIPAESSCTDISTASGPAAAAGAWYKK